MNRKGMNHSGIFRVCLLGAGLVLGGPAAALVFSPAQLDGNNGFTANGPVAFDFAANAVSSAGDINGDGIVDVMVGAYGEADSDKGDVYVIFGQDTSGPGPFPASLELTDLDGTNGFVINGVDTNERVGTALASLGDINNDGVDDVLIGARGNAENSFNNGAAYVVFGRDTTQPGVSFPASFNLSDLVTGGGTDGFVMYGAANLDEAGQSVAGGFDLDGDGINDLAIGAPGTDVNGSASGEVYVIFGRDTGVSGNFPQTQTLPSLASGTGTDGFVLRGVSIDARAGHSVASAGDVNHDGFDDLIIGSIFLSDATAPGQAYIVFGKDTSVSGDFPAVFELSTLSGGGGASGFVLNGLGADDGLGDAVGAAGDVDGDGIDDVIVGDPYADNNGNGAGQAYVVFGRDTAMVGNFPGLFELSTLAAGGGADGFVLNGRDTGSAGTGAGRQVGSAGDFNGDGINDFFVSDREAFGSVFAGGEVYILFGQDTSVSGNFDQVIELGNIAADPGPLGLVIQGQDVSDNIGGAVALAGDVNDDGHADLIIGAPEADPNGGNSGEAHVIYAPGRDNTPPEVTAPGSLNSLEDTPITFGAGFVLADGESDNLTVTLSIDDTLAVFHLDPVAGVDINGNDTSHLTLAGALTDLNTALPLVEVIPFPDGNGQDTIDIRAYDGYFIDEAFPFTLFLAVNDPPVFTQNISPVEVLEDGGTLTVEDVLTQLGSGDPEQTFPGSINFDESNDNNALFLRQPGLFQSEVFDANVFLELNPEVSGTATVSFTAFDDKGTANGGDNDTTGQFDIVVLPVNDPPTFSIFGDIQTGEDALPQTFPNFATGMDDGDPFEVQNLSFSLSSNSPGLFSVEPVIDPAGDLTYTVAADANGSALVTVTLNDDGGTDNGGINSSSQDFTLTVDPVNDQPSFTVGDDVEALDTDGAVSIPNWATNISPGPANESGQMVTFEIVSNTAPELFSAGPAVSTDGTLSFTPEDLADGSATIEIRPIDDGPTGQPNDEIGDTQSFMITITEAPSADLSISKSNGTAFIPISPVTIAWSIIVENLGTEDVTGAEVQDIVPANGSNGFWNCTPFDGATCTASGNDDLIDIIDLPAGSRVEYNFFVEFTLVEGEVVENTAVVIPPELPVDRNLENNTATDRDPFALYFDGFETE